MALAAQKVDRDSWIRQAAGRMMAAAARLLVGRLDIKSATSLLQQAYVDEARQRLEHDPKQRRVTRSALSLMTGLDTRTIAALEKNPPRERFTSPMIAILENWGQHWTDDHGEPIELPVYGEGRSLETLVYRYCGRNITARAVVDELIDRGCAVKVGKRRVRLVNRYYTPADPSERDAITAGVHNFACLADTVAHNAEAGPDTPRRLQQDRWTTDIPAPEAERVHADLRGMLEDHIDQVVAYLEAEEAAAEGDPNPRIEIGVGWYVWEDPHNRRRAIDPQSQS